uniref:Uncharacterized protein n=1 Tax=Rhizophora mucronata TaxID=61149 RepID=A0A2P2R131_RHIMU
MVQGMVPRLHGYNGCMKMKIQKQRDAQ